MSSNFAISLVIGAAVGGALSGIGQVSQSLNILKDRSKSISERLRALNQASLDGMKKSAAALTAIGGSVVAFSKPAIEFESAMADVKKVVDFETPEGFAKLSKDLLDLTDVMPMSAKELATIAASGGQLGVAEKDIKSFTETIAKMSVAFGMSAEEAGDSMAKLANVYQIPINEIGKLGDAINELSNNNPAKAADIVNALGRVGGVAKQFGLTENAAASLSSAFISLGKRPEVAGTAINGMLTKLMTADKAGNKFQDALKQVGISATQLKKNIAHDGEAALVDFLKRLQTLPKDAQMGILVDLFGLEYADDVAVLAGNVELLEKNIRTLQDTDENGQLKYLGSMEKEFEERAKTTEANLAKLGNAVTKIGISIGNYLLPIINNFLGWLQPKLLWIADIINKNNGIMGSVAKWGSFAVAAVGGFVALMGALSGFVWVGLKLASVFKMAWSVISFGGTAITFVVKGVWWLGSAIAGMLVPIISKLAFGLGYLIGSMYKMAIVAGGALVKGLMIAGKALMFLGRALLMNPIGLVITAIAAGAYLIWDNWATLQPFFADLWATICENFNAAWEWIKSAWSGVSEWVDSVWGGVTDFFSNLWTNITDLFSSGIGNISAQILNWSPLGLFYSVFSHVLNWFGIELPSSFSEFGSSLISSFTEGVMAMWNRVKGFFLDIANWVKGLFSFEENVSVTIPNAPDVPAVPKSPSTAAAPKVSVPVKNALPFTMGQSIYEPDEAASGKKKSKKGKETKSTGSDTPKRSRSSSSPSNNYQPLRSQAPQSEPPAMPKSITVNFNPTINLGGANGAETAGLREQVQQVMQESAWEFEKLMYRILDQRSRRVY